MAFSIVQHVGNGNTGTSVSVTCSATTAGNLLVAALGLAFNPTGSSTVTAPSGWQQVGSNVSDVGFFEIQGSVFYLPNCAGGSTSFTWTLGTAPGFWDILFIEISGAATSTPLDVSNFSNTQLEQTSDSKSITTTASGDIVLGLVVFDEGNQTTSAYNDGTGYTLIGTQTDAFGWMAVHAAYQVQTSAGAISYAPTWTGSADDILWAVSFKAAGGGGGPTLKPSTLALMGVG